MDIYEASGIAPANIQKSFVLGSAVGLLGIVLYQLVRKKGLDKDDDDYGEELTKDMLSYIEDTNKTTKQTSEVTGGNNNHEDSLQNNPTSGRPQSKVHVRTMVKFFENQGGSDKHPEYS